jgi:hypothetical protein
VRSKLVVVPLGVLGGRMPFIGEDAEAEITGDQELPQGPFGSISFANSGAGPLGKARVASRPRMVRTEFAAGPGFRGRGSVGATQGADVGQHTLLRPAADRLWGHLEELGDLRCAQVLGLGCLDQRPLPFLLSSPRFGDDSMPVGVGRHPAFYTGWPFCNHPGAAWFPSRCMHGR